MNNERAQPVPAPASRSQPCRGRFAPSPTGPLHFGSLVAAAGSYLQAKTRQGEWLVRIDDIDPPRELPGASDGILRTLERFGFEWDGPVSYQSRRTVIYQAALDALQVKGAVYPCACSRRTIAALQADPSAKPVYPGTCRTGLGAGKSPRLLRINTRGAVIRFEDRLQGACHYDLEAEVGDFVVLRADGLFAYQLATGIDDAEQGITEVVRGCDLLGSTPQQIHVQRCLGLDSPSYCHLPVAVNSDGQKLSKQNLAPPLDAGRAPAQLWQALTFLGQNPPAELARASLHTLWQWAFAHWQTDKIDRTQAIPQ